MITMERSYRQNLSISGIALLINALLFIVLPYFMMAQKTPTPLGNDVAEGFRFIDTISFPEESPLPTPEKPRDVVRPPERQEMTVPEDLVIPLRSKGATLPHLPVETVHIDITPRPIASPSLPFPDSDRPNNVTVRERAVYNETEVDHVPVTIAKTPPAYPYRARRLNISGEVNVTFLVDTNGAVRNIKIMGADPPGVFDRNVLEALTTWRFEPGLLRGRPVTTRVTTSIVFRLEDAG